MATLAAASALARTRAVTGRLLNPPRALRSPLALRDVAGHSPRLSLSLTITLTSPNPTRTQHPNPGRGALRSARGSAHLRRRAGRGHGAEDRGGPARFLPEPAGDRAGRGHQGQARGLLRDLWPDSPLTPPPGRGAFRLYCSPLFYVNCPRPSSASSPIVRHAESVVKPRFRTLRPNWALGWRRQGSRAPRSRAVSLVWLEARPSHGAGSAPLHRESRGMRAR